MTRSANEVMQEVIFAAAMDAIRAFKEASHGLPNTLLRDLNAVHANTTFADLPKEVQAAITASVRAAFTRLLKEGYSVSAEPLPPPQRSPAFRREPDRERGGTRRPPGRGPRPEGGRPPRKGPPRGGKPPRGR
jgi:hypothetical protein